MVYFESRNLTVCIIISNIKPRVLNHTLTEKAMTYTVKLQTLATIVSLSSVYSMHRPHPSCVTSLFSSHGLKNVRLIRVLGSGVVPHVGTAIKRQALASRAEYSKLWNCCYILTREELRLLRIRIGNVAKWGNAYEYFSIAYNWYRANTFSSIVLLLCWQASIEA